MKQRFSSLDIKVIAHELAQSILSLRVVNIYDLSSRIFLIKLAKPDHRQQLLLDSGFRVHLTSFARTTAAAPSAFVTRLRKFLKTRRVTSVAQVGTDRILEIQFSDGLYRLFLEFYAGGNVILTDKDLNVIALLRVVTEGAEHEQVHLGSVYNLSERQQYNGVPPLTIERVKDGIQKFVDRQASTEGQQATGKKIKKKGGDNLRKALASAVTELPPMLLEHALRVKAFDTTIPPDEVLRSDELLGQVMEVLQEASRTVENIMATSPAKGYIIAKRIDAASKTKTESISEINSNAEASKDASNLLYDDYHPFKPRQATDDATQTIVEFEGFNAAVDEFYSSIEGQKLESRLQEKEETARKKLEHTRTEQEKRVGGLQAVQETNVRKAQAIEANIERVEEATAAINGLIAQGMDWGEVEKLIELEKKKGNPVAEYIKLPLKLNENTATLLLGEWETNNDDDEADLTDEEPSDSEDSEVETKRSGKPKKEKKAPADKRLAVDIDLALSGYSNAREYYDQKRTAAVKTEKTLLASEKALKSAQVKIEADLKKALKQEKQVLRPVRKAFWFEKFTYFISSDGYLVLGGKDAMQTDILYKKYLKQGDVFVHAELSGAAPVIVKNKAGMTDAPIPPSTLSQAGNLCVATSSAWDSKAVMSAWWAPAERVTKIAPTGDYLGPGSFHLKGEKSFLPPAQLLLGFAVLFQISEDSKARHNKHRVPVEASSASDIKSESAATPETSLPLRTVSDDPEDEPDADLPEHTDDENMSDNASETHDEDHSSAYQNPLQSGTKVSATDDEESHLNTEDDEAEAEAPTPDEHPTRTVPDEPTTTELETELNDEIPDDDKDEDENENDDEVEDDLESEPNTTPSTPATAPPTGTSTPNKSQTQTQTQTNKPLPRGKRTKAKKLRTKYADQDESDRALAMSLLGSKAGQDKAAADAASKAAAADLAAEQKSRRREQALKKEREHRAVEAEKEREKVRNGEIEGGEDDGADEGLENEVDLDAFVGMPLVGDTLLEALPICAPWASLAAYKYKVKLQPGATKRGKVVREVLEHWNRAAAKKGVVDEKAEDAERMWPRERELLGNWREAEVVGVVPVGKARVVASAIAGGGGKSGGGAGKGKGGGRGGRGAKKSR